MAQHIPLVLPNDPDKDIWSYYELHWINPMVFADHLVAILPVPLVDKSLVINVYKFYNLPILYPALQKAFQYLIEGEYHTLSSDGDNATHSSE